MPMDVPFPPDHTAGAQIPLLPIRPEDAVFYTEFPGTPGEVLITLSSDPRITWWKGLEVRVRDGNAIGMIETQDANHGPISLCLRAGDQNLGELHIRLLKAMMFGVHTAVYDLPNLGNKVGRRLHFHWTRD